jgi:prepilin-type processing-associated H-X9-DG protein
MSRGITRIALFALPALGLIGLALIFVMRWRETANRTRCQDNLRRLAWTGMWLYADRDFNFPKAPIKPGDSNLIARDSGLNPDLTFPPGTLANASLPPERRLSWQVILLPQIARDDVYKQFDLTKAWDDEANHAAIIAKVPALACPTLYSVPPPGEPQLVAYVGMAGLGPDTPVLPPTDPRSGFFRYDEPTKAGMLKRGLSNTMTIIESSRQLGGWAAGGPPSVRGVDPAEQPYVGFGRQFGAHPAGCNVAYADGSVRFMDNSISAKVFEMLVPLADSGER